MRRRELLAGLAGAGVLAGGGAVAIVGPPSFDGGDDDSSPRSDRTFEVETVDLPWSDAGTLTVPDDEHVTLLKFFATTCSSCQTQLSKVTEARSRVPDDVRFLSVTSELVGPDGQVTEAELREWWDEHGGGEWPIGIDETAALQVHYEGFPIPSAVIVDTDGTVRWSHAGVASADELVSAVETAIDGDR